jgi:hypothetical protein
VTVLTLASGERQRTASSSQLILSRPPERSTLRVRNAHEIRRMLTGLAGLTASDHRTRMGWIPYGQRGLAVHTSIGNGALHGVNITDSHGQREAGGQSVGLEMIQRRLHYPWRYPNSTLVTVFTHLPNLDEELQGWDLDTLDRFNRGQIARWSNNDIRFQGNWSRQPPEEEPDPDLHPRHWVTWHALNDVKSGLLERRRNRQTAARLGWLYDAHWSIGEAMLLISGNNDDLVLDIARLVEQLAVERHGEILTPNGNTDTASLPRIPGTIAARQMDCVRIRREVGEPMNVESSVRELAEHLFDDDNPVLMCAEMPIKRLLWRDGKEVDPRQVDALVQLFAEMREEVETLIGKAALRFEARPMNDKSQMAAAARSLSHGNRTHKFGDLLVGPDESPQDQLRLLALWARALRREIGGVLLGYQEHEVGILTHMAVMRPIPTVARLGRLYADLEIEFIKPFFTEEPVAGVDQIAAQLDYLDVLHARVAGTLWIPMEPAAEPDERTAAIARASALISTTDLDLTSNPPSSAEIRQHFDDIMKMQMNGDFDDPIDPKDPTAERFVAHLQVLEINESNLYIRIGPTGSTTHSMEVCSDPTSDWGAVMAAMDNTLRHLDEKNGDHSHHIVISGLRPRGAARSDREAAIAEAHEEFSVIRTVTGATRWLETLWAEQSDVNRRDEVYLQNESRRIVQLLASKIALEIARTNKVRSVNGRPADARMTSVVRSQSKRLGTSVRFLVAGSNPVDMAHALEAGATAANLAPSANRSPFRFAVPLTGTTSSFTVAPGISTSNLRADDNHVFVATMHRLFGEGTAVCAMDLPTMRAHLKRNAEVSAAQVAKARELLDVVQTQIDATARERAGVLPTRTRRVHIEDDLSPVEQLSKIAERTVELVQRYAAAFHEGSPTPGSLGEVGGPALHDLLRATFAPFDLEIIDSRRMANLHAGLGRGVDSLARSRLPILRPPGAATVQGQVEPPSRLVLAHAGIA